MFCCSGYSSDVSDWYELCAVLSPRTYEPGGPHAGQHRSFRGNMFQTGRWQSDMCFWIIVYCLLLKTQSTTCMWYSIDLSFFFSSPRRLLLSTFHLSVGVLPRVFKAILGKEKPREPPSHKVFWLHKLSFETFFIAVYSSSLGSRSNSERLALDFFLGVWVCLSCCFLPEWLWRGVCSCWKLKEDLCCFLRSLSGLLGKCPSEWSRVTKATKVS